MPPEQTATIDAPPANQAPANAPVVPAGQTPPAPPAPPEPPKEPGQETVSAFADRFTGKRKAATPPKVEDKNAAAAPPAQPPKPAKGPPKPAVIAAPPVEPDYEKLGAAVAKGIVEAQKVTTAKPGPTDDLTDEQKETVAVLERMEKEWPDTYRGHSKAFIEASRKATKYREDWEKANPGETFDPESETHNEFFANNEVDWDDNHYTKMLARMEAECVTEKATSKTKDELAEIKQRERLRESESVIVARQIETAREYFAKLGDEYKGVLDEQGNLNVEEVKRIQASDPIKTIAFQSARNVEVFAGELHKLVEGLQPFNPDNPVHREINRFISEEESLMKSLPPEQTVFQGKQFATAEEFAAMPPERQKKHWRYTEKDLARINAERAAERAAEFMATEEKRLEQFAKARGFVKAEAQTPASTPPAPSRDAYILPTQKPTSPSGTVGPIVAPATGGNAKGANSATSSFLARFRG